MKKLILIVISMLSYSILFSQATDINVLEKKEEVYYLNGKFYSGNCYAKHENGKIGLKGQIKNGLKEGTWIWYYSDGTKKRESAFINNQMEGLTMYWHANGVKAKEIMYKAGKNIDQKLWNEDGTRKPNPTFQQSSDN